MALKITEDNFQSEIIDAGGVSLVDFGATWCQPCQALSPIIDELADEYSDSGVKISKCDVDEASGLAAQFAIMSVPTILFFKDGQKVDSMTGLQSKAALKSKIDSLVGS